LFNDHSYYYKQLYLNGGQRLIFDRREVEIILHIEQTSTILNVLYEAIVYPSADQFARRSVQIIIVVEQTGVGKELHRGLEAHLEQSRGVVLHAGSAHGSDHALQGHVIRHEV
jgi:hypothetical protein